MMLTGQRKPMSAQERLSTLVLYLVLMSPLLLFAGAMVFVGILSLGPGPDIRSLWTCLPAGLLFIGILGFALYWSLWHVPAQTIQWFALEGDELKIETPAHGSISKLASTIEAIVPYHVGRRRTLRGWWLRCGNAGRVYLDRETPNAEELVSQLERLMGQQQGK